MDLASGGDIWSTGAFSFESPLKDLLDSGEFTLEQLLAEDELLQEVRGCHQKLIDFFTTEQAVTKLVQYVILPPTEMHFLVPESVIAEEEHLNGDVATKAVTQEVSPTPKEPGEWLRQHLEDVKSGNKQKKEPEKDPALKHIRFPYMACEIICCEIPSVINTLVEGKCVFEEKERKSETDEEEDPSHPEANDIIPNASEADMMEVVPKEKDDKEGATAILDLLFSLLHDTPPGELDDYRAGYFDKILTVLFRKRPEELTNYINSGGAAGRPALMQSLLKHLYSHSIMQIAQRLLLPPRPVEQSQQQQQEGDEIVAGDDDEENEGALHCDWGNSPEVLDMLLDTLVGKPPHAAAADGPSSSLTEAEEEQQLDLSLNASEVLITVIQNSMLSSPTMLSLTSSETVRRVVDAATTVRGDYFSPRESLLTSAMNVLESLILQLGGYGAVGTMTLLTEEEMQMQQMELQEQQVQQESENGTEEEGTVPQEDPADGGPVPTETDDPEPANENEGAAGEEEPLISDLTSLLEHLPRMLENLSNLLRHPSTTTWTSPTQFSKSEPQQLLGNSRLRIVRVLESLVLLGDPAVDSKLVQSDCLEICLDFFWKFQWCSMLHQSVANLLVHVFEGQNARYEMQEYFIVKCNLLGRLMDSFVEEAHVMGVGGGLPSSGSVTRIAEVVENLQDVAISSVESEKGSSTSGEAPLPVSEDDVDAAMETENGDGLGEPVASAAVPAEAAASESPAAANVEQVSTEAVRFESRDVSTVGDAVHTPSQAFRYGYMGHVIIICQALVHAYTNDPQEMAEGDSAENAAEENDARALQRQESSGGGSAVSEYDVPKDDYGEPLLLAELVMTHPLADRWQEFVETTLAAETAVQSTPLGGYSMQSPGMDPMHSHRPGLADEGYMMGDDGEGPPAPPRGMLGGGDVIDMDDNDLDIAASMMASLSLGRAGASNGDGDDDDNDNSDHSGSGDSNRSYNSGETASEKSGYAFDDPLGKAGGLGIELGKLTKYKADDEGDEKPAIPGTSDDDSDEGSHSSSDEEPESDHGNDNDVPVMDLFAGNFDHGSSDQPTESAAPVEEFANFAEFDSAGNVAGPEGDDAFGPFAGASDAVPTDASNDPFANSTSTKSDADLEDIFGKGDHANLLEQEDEEEAEDESSVPAEPVSAEPIVVAASPVSPEVEGKDGSADESPIEADELLTAPSDELLADDDVPKEDPPKPIENGDPHS